ncbi:MAG: hypothetical protein MZV63_33875 [Marinilabiliales bacterium]|nr:hypothetical protein [Marinilabiliales bacterium]
MWVERHRLQPIVGKGFDRDHGALDGADSATRMSVPEDGAYEYPRLRPVEAFPTTTPRAAGPLSARPHALHRRDRVGPSANGRHPGSFRWTPLPPGYPRGICPSLRRAALPGAAPAGHTVARRLPAPGEPRVSPATARRSRTTSCAPRIGLPVWRGRDIRRTRRRCGASWTGISSPKMGPRMTPTSPEASRLNGLVVPHIDFARGGPCYAWGYREAGRGHARRPLDRPGNGARFHGEAVRPHAEGVRDSAGAGGRGRGNAWTLCWRGSAPGISTTSSLTAGSTPSSSRGIPAVRDAGAPAGADRSHSLRIVPRVRGGAAPAPENGSGGGFPRRPPRDSRGAERADRGHRQRGPGARRAAVRRLAAGDARTAPRSRRRGSPDARGCRGGGRRGLLPRRRDGSRPTPHLRSATHLCGSAGPRQASRPPAPLQSVGGSQRDGYVRRARPVRTGLGAPSASA